MSNPEKVKMRDLSQREWGVKMHWISGIFFAIAFPLFLIAILVGSGPAADRLAGCGALFAGSALVLALAGAALRDFSD